MHSSEVTLETPKARLISIPAFSIQWKLFFPHNLCPVATGCPEMFQIQPASSFVALALAELEKIYCAAEVVLPWQLRHTEF